MAIIQKVKVGDEWVKVSSSNNSGSSSSGTDIFIINSDKDFEVIEDSSLIGVIKDSNTTYEKLKNAINNNYTIALKEPRGNISYCLRADFVLEDEESGNKRIALFFTKSILTIRYDIILYIGLNNSIVYMISKNDIFSKKEVEESIDNKATYIGEEKPTTDTVLWVDDSEDDDENLVTYTTVYTLPDGLFTGTNESPYEFTEEERKVFNAYGNFEDAIIYYKNASGLKLVTNYGTISGGSGLLIQGNCNQFIISGSGGEMSKLDIRHMTFNIVKYSEDNIVGFGEVLDKVTIYG